MLDGWIHRRAGAYKSAADFGTSVLVLEAGTAGGGMSASSMTTPLQWVGVYPVYVDCQRTLLADGQQRAAKTHCCKSSSPLAEWSSSLTVQVNEDFLVCPGQVLWAGIEGHVETTDGCY